MYRACQIDPIVTAVMHALRANCCDGMDVCVVPYVCRRKQTCYVRTRYDGYDIYQVRGGKGRGGDGRWGMLEVTEIVGVSNCNSNLRAVLATH